MRRWGRIGLVLVVASWAAACAGPYDDGAVHEVTLRRNPRCLIWYAEVEGARYETRTPPPGADTLSPRVGELQVGADGAATFVGEGYELEMWGGPEAFFRADCPMVGP